VDREAGRLPLRRFEIRASAPAVSPPPSLPLVRLTARQSVVSDRLVGPSGSPPPPFPRRFRRRLRFLPVAVRRLLTQAVSSSPSFVPLQSAALPDPPRPQPCGFTAKHLPWGSSPSSRRQPAASCDGLPKPTALHPRRFSRPRWLAPPLALWVCFTPQPRPGFSLQGLAPRIQPDHLVGGPCPLVVGAETLPAVARQRHVPSPRPQGLAPDADPLSVQR